MISHYPIPKLWQQVVVVAGFFTLQAAMCRAETAPTTPVGDEKAATDLRHIPPNAIAFYSVNVPALLQLDAIRKLKIPEEAGFTTVDEAFEKSLGIQLENVRRMTLLQQTFAQPEPVYCFTTLKPYNRDAVLKRLAPSAALQKYKGKSLYVKEQSLGILFMHDRLLLGRRADLHWYIDHIGQAKKGPLTPALTESAGNHTVTAAFTVSDLLKPFGGQIPNELQPFAGVFEAKLGTLTVDIDTELKARLTLDFAKNDEATEGRKGLQRALKLGQDTLAQGLNQLAKSPKWQKQKSLLKMLRQMQSALKRTSIDQKGASVHATAQMPFDAQTMSVALAEAVAKTREAAARMESSNNLKQLAIAMHAYYDAHKRLPPAAIYDKDGKPLLSWRVLLLPYLEENQLYQQFRLNEPWDSSHNRKLLKQMPEVFALPGGKGLEDFQTHYQGIVGKGTIFDGTRGITFADIIDGTSNTIMIVEAKKAVPWTKPEDVAFDPTKGTSPFGGRFEGGFQAGFCDGSVHFIADSINPATLRLLILRNDRMPVPDF